MVVAGSKGISLATLISFFEARRGQLYGFRWKDWSDFKSCLPSCEVGPLDQDIGRGDGRTLAFQLRKSYVSGDQNYARPVLKPVKGSVRVALAGDPKVETLEYNVDLTLGQVTFVTPPDIDVRVTAGFEYDVPVRFDTDRFTTSIATFNAGDVPAVPVIEVRL